MLKARNIIFQALNDRKVAPDRYMAQSMTWVREALLLIGRVPEAHGLTCEIPIQHDKFGIMDRPDDLIKIVEFKLLGTDGCQYDTIFRGRNSIEIWNNEVHPESKTGVGSPQIGDNGTCFFFMAGDPEFFSCAQVHYTGFLRDENGEYLVDEVSEMAVKSYLNLKISMSERSLSRNAVPLEEINLLTAEWKQQLKHAYAKIKSPGKAKLMGAAFRNKQKNYPSPGFNVFMKPREKNQPKTSSSPSENGGGVIPNNALPPAPPVLPTDPVFSFNPQTAWQFQDWATNASNELLYILMDHALGGNISSVDSHPNGTVTFADSSTATMVWNVQNGRYEPLSSPLVIPQSGTNTFSVAGIELTLTNQATGTGTFDDSFEYNLVVQNQDPSVSNVRILGDFETNGMITLLGDYTDPDGDPNDSILELFQSNDIDGILNVVSLGTFAHGATYLLASSTVSKYVKLRYTPRDDQGNTGTFAESIVYGPIDVGPYLTENEDPDFFRMWDFNTEGYVSNDSEDTLVEVASGNGDIIHVPNAHGDTGRGAYRFEGGDFLTGPLTGPLTREITIFLVVRLDQVNVGVQNLIEQFNFGVRSNFQFYYNSNNSKYYFARYNDTNLDLSSNTHPIIRSLPDNWVVIAASNTSLNPSTDKSQLWINETKAYESSTRPATDFAVANSIQIGRSVEGLIAKIVICDSGMDDERILRMLKLLKNQYPDE